MGLAASQARFLSLTGRKTNVEYQGQQVNQQRTTLANQTASYYNQLLMLGVPTPPSTTDFTRVVYSFDDGAYNNEITFIVAKPNGEYQVSYKSSWQNDNALLTGDSHIAVSLGTDDTINLYEQFMSGTVNGCYTYLMDTSHDAIDIRKQFEHMQHVINHMLWYGSYTTSDGNSLSVSGGDIYWTTPTPPYGGDRVVMEQIAGKIDGTTTEQKLVDLLYENESIYNSNTETQESLDVLRNRLRDIVNIDLKSTLNRHFRIGKDTLRVAGYIEELTYNGDGTIKGYFGNDEYLKTLSPDELTELLAEEQKYITELDNKFGADTWLVRYVKNTTSGMYEAQFYSRQELVDAYYNNNSGSESSIKYHYIGSEKESAEIKGVPARFEQDATGRYTSITIHSDDPAKAKTYALKTNVVTDQVAYENAMNKYEHDKYQYEQTMQQINAKIKGVQAKDKSLELKLRQLDTEQDAISQEMEAIQKVIEKNTEKSFDLFG